MLEIVYGNCIKSRMNEKDCSIQELIGLKKLLDKDLKNLVLIKDINGSVEYDGSYYEPFNGNFLRMTSAKK